MSKFLKSNSFEIVTLVISIVIVTALALLTLDDGEKTPLENQLISYLMFVFSAIISWIFSKMYSERGATRELAKYGVQLAIGMVVLRRNVAVLKRRISERIASNVPEAFLNDLETVQFALDVFDSQVEGSLKSMTGIIDDALKEQDEVLKLIREKEQTADKRINTIIENESINDDQKALEIDRLKAEMREEIRNAVRNAPLPISFESLREDVPRQVTAGCPHCGADNTFTILGNPGQTKLVKCSNCGRGFNAHVRPGGSIFVRKHLSPAGLVRYPYGPLQSDYEWQSSLKSLKDEFAKLWEAHEFGEIVNIVFASVSELQSRPDEFNVSKLFKRVAELASQGGVPANAVRKMVYYVFRSGVFRFDGAGSYQALISGRYQLQDILGGLCRSMGFQYAKRHRGQPSEEALNEAIRFICDECGLQISRERAREHILDGCFTALGND